METLERRIRTRRLVRVLEDALAERRQYKAEPTYRHGERRTAACRVSAEVARQVRKEQKRMTREEAD
jgi:hypothetical protein